MNNIGYIEDLIKKKLQGSNVEVTLFAGKADHLEISVEHDSFKDKKLIEQHRVVMDILQDELKSNNIHAVKLKTFYKE